MSEQGWLKLDSALQNLILPLWLKVTGTGIATDCVMECAMESLWFFKVYGRGRELLSNLWVGWRSLLRVSLCTPSLKGTVTSQSCLFGLGLLSLINLFGILSFCLCLLSFLTQRLRTQLRFQRLLHCSTWMILLSWCPPGPSVVSDPGQQNDMFKLSILVIWGEWRSPVCVWCREYSRFVLLRKPKQTQW